VIFISLTDLTEIQYPHVFWYADSESDIGFHLRPPSVYPFYKGFTPFFTTLVVTKLLQQRTIAGSVYVSIIIYRCITEIP
jgi:hypothetical protein